MYCVQRAHISIHLCAQGIPCVYVYLVICAHTYMYITCTYIGHIHMYIYINWGSQYSERSPCQDDPVVCERPQSGYKQLQTPEV